MNNVPSLKQKFDTYPQTVPRCHYVVNNFNIVCQKDSIECNFIKMKTKLNNFDKNRDQIE